MVGSESTHGTETVTLRPMRDDDLPTLVEMVRRMWYADGSTPETCSRRLASADMGFSLARSTMALVAESAGRVCGVLLARVDALSSMAHGRATPFNRHCRLALREVLPFPFSRAGLRGLRDACDLLVRDARLLHGLSDRYDGEVVLFVVDERLRGRGVGRLLFDEAMLRFREAGVLRYFLFTDSTCDVGFYDHRGLVRMRSSRVRHADGSADEFYLYEGETRRQHAVQRGR